MQSDRKHVGQQLEQRCSSHRDMETRVGWRWIVWIIDKSSSLPPTKHVIVDKCCDQTNAGFFVVKNSHDKLIKNTSPCSLIMHSTQNTLLTTCFWQWALTSYWVPSFSLSLASEWISGALFSCVMCCTSHLRNMSSYTLIISFYSRV